MRAVSSLTNRIFLACTLLAVLSLGFAFYFVHARASAEAEAELRRGLAQASTIVEQHRTTLTDTFTRMARLVADQPTLKAAVDTGDPPTVQPLADDYRERMSADLLVLTDPRDALLASAGGDAALLPAEAGDAATTEETASFVAHPLGVLQVVSVPILLGFEPEVLGRLTVGYFMDDRLATQFKSLTGSEIAFAAQGRVLASSLPPDARPALDRVLGAADIVPVTLGSEEYLALARPMHARGARADAGGAPATMILQSRTERLRFLNTVRAGLTGALVVTILLATILSYVVARTMTRPLAAVTGAMGEVATTGDLTRKVTLRSRPWDDEDARLLATAFNTLTESIARFQREAAQKERLSSLGRMSTVIAHELRNPLMIIRASLGTLRREDATAADRQEATADIDEETRRLNHIVTEVLDFAKPIRFELADADLNEICRASAAAAWPDGNIANVRFELDASLPAVATDAERLRIALVNVMTNARHAVESVTVAATAVTTSDVPGVIVSTRRRGGRVTLTVQDRGGGIAPEDMAHIFDPYFTTRRAGTGLGLAIARNIVEGLGGSIAATSRTAPPTSGSSAHVGAAWGTEIRIDLPLAPPEAAA